ncbi:MAG: ribosome maturation factor RimP [Candidatus Omnitrophota bacterium]
MIEKIREIIEPIIIQEGAELVEIVYRRESGRQVLRFMVDKERGIELSECVKLNEKIGQALDESDIITENYILEVNSPGIDRLFKTKKDYIRASGRIVRVTLSEAILDKKEYIGRLEDIMEDSIKVDAGKKGIIEIPFSNIRRARQEVKF